MAKLTIEIDTGKQAAQAALDDSIEVVGVGGCREKVCWCHDPRAALNVPEFCSGCGCRL